MSYKEHLNAKSALIWRIIHRENFDWILRNGLHSQNSELQDPSYTNIGDRELISKRATHHVPIDPGGCLSDYVPFYFTPFSVMMKNIKDGRGIKQRENDEIIILVSSLYNIHKYGLNFVFTDMHAYFKWTKYYSDLSDLDKIDWVPIQNRDFRRDPDDPKKIERYQAEALIYQKLPVEALMGVICYTDDTKTMLDQQINEREQSLIVHARPGWYFR